LLRITSIMLPRVSRAMAAIWGSASATIGSTALAGRAQPPTGSQASHRPKIRVSIGATTKFGTVMPVIAVAITI
jgi:hypothetical protein